MRVTLDVYRDTTIHDLVRVGSIVPSKPEASDHKAWICSYRGQRYVVFATDATVAGTMLLWHVGAITEMPDGSVPGAMWELQFNGVVVWHGGHSVIVEHNPAEVVRPGG